MKKSTVVKKIKEAVADHSEVKLNIRLKCNGRFSSVSGKVKEIKVSNEGEPYLVVKPSSGIKDWQSVRLNNVLMVKKDGQLVKK